MQHRHNGYREDRLGSLPRRDPLRPLVEKILAGDMTPAEALPQALDRLETPRAFRWQAVAVSAWLVGEADPPPAERQRALAALRPLAAEGAYLGLGPALVTLNGPIAGVVLGERAARQLREAAIEALGALRDVQSTAVLAAACCAHDAHMRRAGQAALERVLGTLRAAHYGNLDVEAVPALCRTLLRGTTPEASRPLQWEGRIERLILDALERVGDGRAVEAVRRVARKSLHADIRERAEQLLPVLLARQAREEESAHLLRPADPPPDDTLLRPAASTPDTPSERLLRPADRTDP